MQFRTSFPKESNSRAKKPLEITHVVVYGPIKPSSLGKNNYFLLFMDDFSRKTWVYFLNKKSEVFSDFKKFKVAMEKDSGRKIKTMRTKKLSKEFRPEAVACAVYLSNRSPIRSVWGKTPQEALSGRKHGTSHLRVFGCIAHVYVPYERRAKLDDKSERFIFIDYDSSSKGYKLYNLNNRW